MSRAYESALDISFDIRRSLFVRQIHHWTAVMFAVSIMVHLARIFFTGAFRPPNAGSFCHSDELTRRGRASAQVTAVGRG